LGLVAKGSIVVSVVFQKKMTAHRDLKSKKKTEKNKEVTEHRDLKSKKEKEREKKLTAHRDLKSKKIRANRASSKATRIFFME